ncbi:hypothetical protein T439DRAFT_320960 [Meredithblackwellia eburnea MCA 4105]
MATSHGLFFPRPASSSTSTPASASPPHPALSSQEQQQQQQRRPPNNFSTANFAQARAQARIMREPKSPFVPSKSKGKQRDISNCSIDELSQMLINSQIMLQSTQITANLPGGDAKLRNQQARITSRLRELEGVRDINRDLQRTHIDPQATTSPPPIEMDQDSPFGSDDQFTPPRGKKWLIERLEKSSSNALMGTMSLAESIELQRQAAAREREAAEERERQAELGRQRQKVTGGILRDAMKGANPGMNDFMFHIDSDEDREDEDDLDLEGEEEEEDNEALNPYRTAYREGYERAIREGEMERGGAKANGGGTGNGGGEEG